MIQRAGALRVRLRVAAPIDAHPITAVFGAPTVGAAIDDPDRLVILVEDDSGRPIGWAKTHHWPHDNEQAPAGHYLGGLGVIGAWRRRGIGTALTVPRMAWIRKRTDEIWCVINPRNEASLAMHAGLGFREVARGPRFHTTTFDGGVGVLLCAREVPPVDTLTP